MTVLVLNCGSSSVKFAAIDPGTGERCSAGLLERLHTPAARAIVTGPGGAKRSVERPGMDHAAAIEHVVEHLRASDLEAGITAIGHRVVHGGERFSAPIAIDDEVERALDELAALAPLHNPANLVGIRGARAAWPGRPAVAVFDTAFHQTMPPAAYRLPVPAAWYREHGVRRYGFHGTSHHYVALEAARHLHRPLTELCLLTAHLGNGCSATAIAYGMSVDTTMGLTPLGGLVMGTRSGDLDPGILGHVAAARGLDLPTVLHTLNHESGLLGLSGLSNDMRTVLEAREAGHEGASVAVDVFVHTLASRLLGLCASLPRIDALVFTGGIGEHSAPIRAEVASKLWPLGITLDPSLNARHGGPSARIDQAGPAVLVVATDEERMIAQETHRICQELVR